MDILELVHDDERSEMRPFVCSMERCSKAFSRRSDLARHERIHTNDRPYHCSYKGCGKDFIQRSALKVHIRVHTGERPHVCEVCQKAFADSSSLARHRRVHSGKRPYRCLADDCGRTFCRKTTLTKHTRRNHSEDTPTLCTTLAVPVIGSSNTMQTVSLDSSSTAMAKGSVRRSQRYKPRPEYAEHGHHTSSSVDGYSSASYDDGSGCYSSSSFCSTPVHYDPGSPMSQEDTPIFYSPIFLASSSLTDQHSRHLSDSVFSKHSQQNRGQCNSSLKDEHHHLPIHQQHPIPFVTGHPHAHGSRSHSGLSTIDSSVASAYSSQDLLSVNSGGSYSVSGFPTYSPMGTASAAGTSTDFSYASSLEPSKPLGAEYQHQHQHRELLHHPFATFE